MTASNPLAYSVAGAAAAVGVGVTVIRAELRAGRLAKRYIGSKPLILAGDLQAWLEALPAAPKFADNRPYVKS